MSRKEISKTKKNISNKTIKSLDGKKVEIFPYGLITGLSQVKPIFLFKDKEEKDFLPVWLDFSEVDSIHQILQPQLHKNHPYFAHVKILDKLKTSVTTCTFNRFDGYRLYADVLLETANGAHLISERAEDVVCLALAAKARFFTTSKVIDACREIKDFEKLKEIENNLESYQNVQKYLM